MRILLLVLLLAGGSIYEGWAKTTVTYHIITLPFGDNTGQKTGSTVTHKQYRIEAIKCKVDYYNASDKLGLPAKFKSPMLEGNAYTYWVNTTGTTNVIKSGLQTIFINNNSTFYTYTFRDADDATFFTGTEEKTLQQLADYVSGNSSTTPASAYTMSTSPTNGRQKASRTTESG